MKQFFTFLTAFALAMVCLVFSAEAKPPDISINTPSKTRAKSASEKFTVTLPPVVLPTECREIMRRRFIACSDSRRLSKIPTKALNINAIDRFKPDFVPLN